MPIGVQRDKVVMDNMPILILEDDNGQEKIRISSDCSVKLSNDNLDAASAEFWQGVVDFLPVDKAEIVRDKVLLIRAYHLINSLRDILDYDKLNRETAQEFEELGDEFTNLFFREQ